MNAFLRIVRQWAVIMGAVGMSIGCGGGGSDKEDLVVAYDYPSGQTTGGVLQPLEVRPTVSGLAGHRATFSAGDMLPPGLSMDAGTGVISGTPTAAFHNPVTVQLTVDGYEGQLASTVLFSIENPYSLAYAGSYLTVNKAFSRAPNVNGLRPGDGATFAIVPSVGRPGTALPPGISFDTATGVFSGVPTVIHVPGVNDVSFLYSVNMQVRRGTLTTDGGTTHGINLAVLPF